MIVPGWVESGGTAMVVPPDLFWRRVLAGGIGRLTPSSPSNEPLEVARSCRGGCVGSVRFGMRWPSRKP